MADRVVQDGVSIREMAGRTGNDASGASTAERMFLCTGNEDPLACRTALLTQTFYPLDTYDGKPRLSISHKRVTNDGWEFTVKYTNRPPMAAVGEFVVSIDTGGATETKTEAFAQTSFDATGKTASEHGTSINVQNREIQGVDIVSGALRIDIRATIASRFTTDPIGYAKLLSDLTGTVNNAPYLGFGTGELLFLGASGDIVANGNPVLVYGFAASATLTNETIGPVTGINKAGHDYIWFEYGYDFDTGGRVVSLARAAHVATVYNSADFTVMGIGQT